MIIKRIKRFNISTDLNILRAFVDGIRIFDGHIFMAVAYRKGRAFARYDRNFNLIYRIEEQELKKEGFGDFRCFCVDSHGNFLIAGQSHDHRFNLFIIDGDGCAIERRTVSGFPMLESMDITEEGDLILHSPVLPQPVYILDKNDQQTGIGSFAGKSVHSKLARILYGNDGGIYIAYEQGRSRLEKYDREGKTVFSLDLDKNEAPAGEYSGILDICLNPGKGGVLVLRESPEEGRLLESVHNPGSGSEKIKIAGNTRRIATLGKDLLFASGTVFTLWGMVVSMGIYGAITNIDKYKIA